MTRYNETVHTLINWESLNSNWMDRILDTSEMSVEMDDQGEVYLTRCDSSFSWHIDLGYTLVCIGDQLLYVLKGRESNFDLSRCEGEPMPVIQWRGGNVEDFEDWAEGCGYLLGVESNGELKLYSKDKFFPQVLILGQAVMLNEDGYLDHVIEWDWKGEFDV